jgi:hypothetical protein
MFFHRPTATPNQAQRGQAVAEFALVMPLLFAIILGVFEFGVAFAANIGVNRAAQSAALMASEAGSIRGADCLILDEIEKAILPPNHHANILDVRVELTDFRGDTIYGANHWVRSGSTTCNVADKLELTLPYTLVSETYPDTQRCNALSGCAAMTPARNSVDNIAVVVSYRHDWITPLGGSLPLNGDGTGWEFEQRTVFRMEPHTS